MLAGQIRVENNKLLKEMRIEIQSLRNSIDENNRTQREQFEQEKKLLIEKYERETKALQRSIIVHEELATEKRKEERVGNGFALGTTIVVITATGLSVLAGLPIEIFYVIAGFGAVHLAIQNSVGKHFYKGIQKGYNKTIGRFYRWCKGIEAEAHEIVYLIGPEQLAPAPVDSPTASSSESKASFDSKASLDSKGSEPKVPSEPKALSEPKPSSVSVASASLGSSLGSSSLRSDDSVVSLSITLPEDKGVWTPSLVAGDSLPSSTARDKARKEREAAFEIITSRNVVFEIDTTPDNPKCLSPKPAEKPKSAAPAAPAKISAPAKASLSPAKAAPAKATRAPIKAAATSARFAARGSRRS